MLPFFLLLHDLFCEHFLHKHFLTNTDDLFAKKKNTVQFHKSCKKEEIMPENRFPAWN